METESRLDADEIIEQLRDHRAELREYDVLRIGLFGSYAKRTQHNESDIDFLVEFDDTTFDNYMGLKLFLEDFFERDVDLVVEGDLKRPLRHVTEEARYVTPA